MEDLPDPVQQGIASYKNIQLCMIIIFTSNWIFPRARAHMRARKCALRTNAHNARTRVRLYPNINKICILLVYARFGRIPVQYGKSTSI